MKRPNVERMRRAVTRGRRHQLERNRQFRIRADDQRDPEVIQQEANEWSRRVHSLIPGVVVTVHRDPLTLDSVAEWRHG